MNKYSKFFPRYIAFPMAKVWNVSQLFSMPCIKLSSILQCTKNKIMLFISMHKCIYKKVITNLSLNII